MTTSSDAKYFSLGLDFAALGAGPKEAITFLEDYQKMLARLVALPMPTVAAVNGHCTAGGGFFALCHDFTIVSSEKGLFFMNEIDLGLSFADGMAKVLTYVAAIDLLPFFRFHPASLPSSPSPVLTRYLLYNHAIFLILP